MKIRSLTILFACPHFEAAPPLGEFNFLCLRDEICNDRRDRRSCKICASCVNVSRKQRVFDKFEYNISGVSGNDIWEFGNGNGNG